MDRTNDMTNSEAVYGVLAWLTTRERAIRLGAHHDCGQAADVAKKFCLANGLDDPRPNYSEHLVMPVEEPQEWESESI